MFGALKKCAACCLKGCHRSTACAHCSLLPRSSRTGQGFAFRVIRQALYSIVIHDRKKCSYQVGWFSKRAEYMCVRQFSNLADAATDYFLFSLGKVRWNPPETTV